MSDSLLLKLPILLGAIIASGLCLIVYFRRSGSEMLDEYEQAFPGKCSVCSYHAYRIREGRADPSTVPADHRCVEKLARWKGALH